MGSFKLSELVINKQKLLTELSQLVICLYVVIWELIGRTEESAPTQVLGLPVLCGAREQTQSLIHTSWVLYQRS